MTTPQEATDLASRLHSAAIHLLRRLRTEDATTGLSGPAASALSVIVYGGPLSLRHLAAAEQVKPPTITRLVQALERRGLVSRQDDPADRRRQLVAATLKGRTLLEHGRERRVAVLAAALRALPPEDWRKLAGAIQTLEGLVGPAAPWLTRNAAGGSRVSPGMGPTVKRPKSR